MVGLATRRIYRHQPRNERTYVEADGTGASSVTDDVRTDLSVGHRAKDHGRAGDEEGSSVADLQRIGAEEHGVTTHDKRRTSSDKELTAIKAPADEGEEEGEDSADGPRGDAQELLADGRGFLVQGADDSGEEESHALNGDVVEQEDEGNLDCHGGGHATDQLGLVNAVNDLGLTDTLRLDTGNAELLLLLREPAGGLRAVSEGSEGEDAEADSDDALDDEDHAPRLGASERVHVEDTTREQGTKGTSKGSGNHVKRKAEAQLGTLVPTREVVGNAGKHTSLENTEEEADTAKLGLGVNVAGADADDAEADSGGGEEPTGSHPLTADRGRNLEDNVGDVEDRDDGVIVPLAHHAKFLLQTSESSIA